MNTSSSRLPLPAVIFFVVILVLLGIGAAYGGYRYYQVSTQLAGTTSELASTTVALQQAQDVYANEYAKNAQLSAELGHAQDTNNAFDSQLTSLSSTVGTLSKLATIDPELLEKYSKVFFLNENYIPKKLSPLPTAFEFTGKNLQFQSDALPFLEKMIQDADAQSATSTSSASSNLLAISTYRSFGTQEALKSSYKMTYGAGTANSFSADQGYSEHQLGTALDFTTSALGANFTPFDKTNMYAWLTDNAYKYGFILSYPKGNGYYIYEPWHWRFVGVKLATMLHVEHQNFYQTDQRTINNYLVSLFDPITSQ